MFCESNICCIDLIIILSIVYDSVVVSVFILSLLIVDLFSPIIHRHKNFVVSSRKRLFDYIYERKYKDIVGLCENNDNNIVVPISVNVLYDISHSIIGGPIFLVFFFLRIFHYGYIFCAICNKNVSVRLILYNCNT